MIIMSKPINKGYNKKILHHKQELRDALKGKPIYPITIEIFTSDTCNQNCVYCMADKYRNEHNKKMNKELLKKIIKDMAGKTKAINFTGGGEPYVNKEITDSGIVLAKQNGLEVGIITNAELMDDTSINIVVDNCSWVRISLDAITPKIYNTVRYKKISDSDHHIKKVLENIKKLVAKRKQKKQNRLEKIGVQVVLVNENINDLKNVFETMSTIGIDYLQIRPPELRPYANETQYSPEFLKRTKTAIEEVLQKHSNLKNNTSLEITARPDKFKAIDQANFQKKYNVCYGSNFTAVITTDGKVYHCCYWVGIPKFEIGDLSKQSYEEVFMGQKRKNIRNSINISKCQPICKNHATNLLIHENKDKGIDYMIQNFRQPSIFINFL
jgi:radical SAM protein with 4Fe4S-binding SPASM domain